METAIDASRLLGNPSLFETTACDELEKLVSPSVRFILTHYATKHPRYLLKLLNRFDEIYLVAGTLVEGLYFWLWNAGLIEKFYGIKRINKLMVNVVHDRRTRLTRFQIAVSVLEKVWGPYMMVRLENLEKRLLPKLAMKQLKWENGISDRFKITFLKVWPVLRTGLKLSNLVIKVLYLADYVTCTSLLQYMTRISLSRLNQLDHQFAEEHHSKFLQSMFPKPTYATPNSSVLAALNRSIVATLTPVYKFAWGTTDTLLPVGIFLLKFAEWYQNNKPKDTNKDEKIKVPAPAIIPEGFVLKNDNLKDSSLCKLCDKPIHNPGMIETGFVFCYKCIYEHLRDSNKDRGGNCPVTGRKLLGCTWNETANEWVVRGIRRVII